MSSDGTCPNCGRRIATLEPEPSTPWHFKLLVAAVVLYLAWRVVELAGWFL